MAKTPDFTKTLQDVLAKFPVDTTSSFQDAFKSQTALGEKMAKGCPGRCQRSTEITARWAKAIARGWLTARKKTRPNTPEAVSDFTTAAAGNGCQHTSRLRRSREESSDGHRRPDADRWQGPGLGRAEAAEKATRDTQAAVRKPLPPPPRRPPAPPRPDFPGSDGIRKRGR